MTFFRASELVTVWSWRRPLLVRSRSLQSMIWTSAGSAVTACRDSLPECVILVARSWCSVLQAGCSFRGSFGSLLRHTRRWPSPCFQLFSVLDVSPNVNAHECQRSTLQQMAHAFHSHSIRHFDDITLLSYGCVVFPEGLP